MRYLTARYKRNINAILELQLGMMPYTIMWYALGALRSKLVEELCELDIETRILMRGEIDPRSIISLY